MTRTLATLVVATLLVGASAPLGPVGTAAATGCDFPYSSTDATGTNVTVAAEPDRIVTLNPSAAQTMWEIGAEEKVVGLSGFASYLDGAENRTNVYRTSATGVNVEEVVNLTPDLVLAPNTIPNDTVEQLRGAGLTVYKFESAIDVAFIVNKTRLTGRLVGECDGATDRADQLREEVDTIREATQDVDRPRVFYTFFGFTAGEGTFIDTIITTAGGQNVAAEAGISGYKSYSEEIVVSEDPEWILLNSDDPSVPDTAAFEGTTAEEEGNNVTVDANYVSQPAPRIVQPMLTIVRSLHPEEYRAAKRGVEAIKEEEEQEELPSPAFSITSASVNTSRLELHDDATIVVNVSNDGGPGTFEVRLYLNDSLKEIDKIHFEGDESKSLRLHHSFSSWGRYVVRINDRRAGTVAVVKDLDDGAANDTASNASNTTTANATGATATRTQSSTTSEDDPPGSRSATEQPATRTAPATGPGSSPPTRVATSTETTVRESTATRSDGQPGFGVEVGVIALIAAGLAGRRRL